MLEQLDIYKQKQKPESRPKIYTLHLKNSKWIIALNIQHLENNIGKYLGDFGYGDTFLEKAPKA